MDHTNNKYGAASLTPHLRCMWLVCGVNTCISTQYPPTGRGKFVRTGLEFLFGLFYCTLSFYLLLVRKIKIYVHAVMRIPIISRKVLVTPSGLHAFSEDYGICVTNK